MRCCRVIVPQPPDAGAAGGVGTAAAAGGFLGLRAEGAGTGEAVCEGVEPIPGRAVEDGEAEGLGVLGVDISGGAGAAP